MADAKRTSRGVLKKTEKKSDKDGRTLERAAQLLGKNPLLSKRDALRRSGVSEGRDLRRLAGKLERPARKAKVDVRPRKMPQARQQPAAPLLARAPKKVGAVSKGTATAKAVARAAPYHPKTDLPPLQKTSAPPRADVPDVFAMAQPWMALGVHMTATGLAMQARMTKAALDNPAAAMAMKQGTGALAAWLALFRVRSPGKD